MIAIRNLTASEAREHVAALADVLLDCVAGGASVSFMASLTPADAKTFFENTALQVERGERILLAAFDHQHLIGTVQVILAMPPNQPHRAKIAKLLVHRSARGQGIGQLLMKEAESAARRAGKTLLVLDTATGGDAERLYHRSGWTRAGVIPNYARFPDGSPGDTTIFWKDISD
jgi:GNAT superfamily N-acetyltransferase